MTLRAFGENDRHFGDIETIPPEFVRQLDLKAIAMALDFFEIEGLQRATTKTFVTAGRISERHPGDEPDINAGTTAQEQSLERPVQHSHTAAITRAKNEIEVLSRHKKFGDVVRVV